VKQNETKMKQKNFRQLQLFAAISSNAICRSRFIVDSKWTENSVILV